MRPHERAPIWGRLGEMVGLVRSRLVAGVLVAGLALAPASHALAAEPEALEPQALSATVESLAAPAQTGWQTSADGTTYYYDADGTKATGERCLPARDGSGFDWYYFRADGAMVTGEIYRQDDASHTGWYYYDPTTGAMAHGWQDIPSSGGKRVYYDPASGIMWHGEGLVTKASATSDDAHPGWYYFDEATGATQYGWKYVAAGNKWVYYDPEIGYMHHGETYVTGGDEGWCYFDEVTGATAYGWRFVPSNGGKWVYYDPYTGRMWHGEGYVAMDDAVTADPIPGWCYFDEVTGATHYGWKHLADGRYVYYDEVTGRMWHGEATINGAPVHLDAGTGALDESLAATIAAEAPQLLGGAVDTLVAQRYASGSPARVRVIGDSIAAGWGLASNVVCDGDAIVTSQGTFREGSHDYPVWTNRLRAYASGLLNASIPERSLTWFDRLESLPHAEGGTAGFDQTILALGTNDGYDSPQAFEAGLRSLISKARQESQSVVVVSPIPRRQESMSLTIESVSAIEQRVCAEMGVPYLDLYHDFQRVASEHHLGQGELFADAVHPSVMGHEVIWGVLRARLGL